MLFPLAVTGQGACGLWVSATYVTSRLQRKTMRYLKKVWAPFRFSFYITAKLNCSASQEPGLRWKKQTSETHQVRYMLFIIRNQHFHVRQLRNTFATTPNLLSVLMQSYCPWMKMVPRDSSSRLNYTPLQMSFRSSNTSNKMVIRLAQEVSKFL